MVVESCALIPGLVDAMCAGDMEDIEKVAVEVSQAELRADELKAHVRGHLPSTLFLPMARTGLLEMISAMDDVADATEDLAVTATMRKLVWTDTLEASYRGLVDKVMATVACATIAVEELDDLTEASFGGAEAERFLEMVAAIGRAEHEADECQAVLVKQIYGSGDGWSTPDFVLWLKIVEATGSVADAAEGLGNRLRTVVTRG